jgi:multidrug efflux pump subunit AcrA (membrane-fusion protein)
VDLAKAQFAQAGARLDELKINVANTTITSPVSGFIGRRLLDPGAWVTPNSEFISIVDIATVRMVANIVEKDLRRVATGESRWAWMRSRAKFRRTYCTWRRPRPGREPRRLRSKSSTRSSAPSQACATVNFTTERRDRPSSCRPMP